MRASNKFFIVLFCLITAPIFAIIATGIDSVVKNTGLLPTDLKEDLNWFAQNPQTSGNLIIGFYILAGMFVLIAIIALIRTATDSTSTMDKEFLKDVRSR